MSKDLERHVSTWLAANSGDVADALRKAIQKFLKAGGATNGTFTVSLVVTDGTVAGIESFQVPSALTTETSEKPVSNVVSLRPIKPIPVKKRNKGG